MKSLFRSGSFRLLVLICLVVTGIGLWQFWVRHPSGKVPVTLQIESSPWQIGSEVQLSLVADPIYAGKSVSLTVLAPGPAQNDDGIDRAFFGLAGVQLAWSQPDQQEKEIALAAASGAKYIGLDFDWRRIEPEPGKYNWADLDRIVGFARQHNLILVPMLLYTPLWASSISFAPLDFHRASPTKYEDYRDFVYEVVNRYKPNGASSITSNGYGITDWVIWNEPNTQISDTDPFPNEFWIGSLDAYLQLLRAGYEGAHAADPSCNVLNGALTDIFWETEADIVSALERFYDPNGDGNTADGARPFFDTLNVHLYQLDEPDLGWYQERLSKLRQIMVRFGDEGKAIWLTETGYGSIRNMPKQTQPEYHTYVSETVQAEAVRMVYKNLVNEPGLERIFWWSLRDYHYNNSFKNNAMEAHYGLLQANFYSKPSYLAYAQATGFGSQALTLTAFLDDQGKTTVAIPAQFIRTAGQYIIFVQLDDKIESAIAIYQLSSAADGMVKPTVFP